MLRKIFDKKKEKKMLTAQKKKRPNRCWGKPTKEMYLRGNPKPKQIFPRWNKSKGYERQMPRTGSQLEPVHNMMAKIAEFSPSDPPDTFHISSSTLKRTEQQTTTNCGMTRTPFTHIQDEQKLRSFRGSAQQPSGTGRKQSIPNKLCPLLYVRTGEQSQHRCRRVLILRQHSNPHKIRILRTVRTSDVSTTAAVTTTRDGGPDKYGLRALSCTINFSGTMQ